MSASVDRVGEKDLYILQNVINKNMNQTTKEKKSAEKQMNCIPKGG
jgi:hypothetical protein